MERARADTGHENHEIELSGFNLGQKFDGGAVFAERHFAHGRRNDRLAAVAANQLRHFFGAAAFEGDDSKPVQALFPVRCHKAADDPIWG